jgi:hypothetical protein
MKDTHKFALAMFAFLAAIVLILLPIDALYEKNILLNTDMGKKEAEYRIFAKESNENADAVFFGDSLMACAIDNRRLDSSFSFATVGDNYLGIYPVLKRMLDADGVKVKHVGFAIGMHTFSYDYIKYRGFYSPLWAYGKFVPIEEIWRATGRNPLEILIYSNFAVVSNGERLFDRTNFLPILTGVEEPVWAPCSNASFLNYTEAQRAVESQRMVASFVFGNESEINNEYFEKTMEYVRSKNITPIFIDLPETGQYMKTMRMLKVNRSAHHEEVFNRIGKTFKSYYYLDYYNLFENRTELFFDPSHLNDKGSAIFTDILSGDLKRIDSGEIKPIEKWSG